jgi:pimeloyl-ACP methyl ester carboxylesterase
MKKFLTIISVLLLVLVLYLTLRSSNLQELEILKEHHVSETSCFFKYNGHEYHYTQSGQGVPVVFIHGLAGNAFIWDTLINNIDSGYQCFALDLPGFGLSDLDEQLANEDLINYLMGVFEAFLAKNDIDRFHLVGSSMGGYISMEFTNKLSDQVQSLTLSNPLCYDIKNGGKVLTRLSYSLLFHLVKEKGLPIWASRFIFSNTTVFPMADKDVEMRCILNNKKTTISFIQILLTKKTLVKNELAQKIKVPTLIIWGNEDRVLSPEYAKRLQRDISNSKLTLYKDIGHLSFYENVIQFKYDMMNFIQGLADSNIEPLIEE